jgi:hypothetical protein
VTVDAVGVTKSLKTDSRPLERKRSTSMKELLEAVTMGKRDEDLFISLAGRLARLERQLTDQEKEAFEEKAKGKTLREKIPEYQKIRLLKWQRKTLVRLQVRSLTVSLINILKMSARFMNRSLTL